MKKKVNLSRRGFLTSLSLLPFLSSAVSASVVSNKRQGLFINGHHDQAGKFYISGMDFTGSEQFRTVLPEMPHGFTIDPNNANRLVTFPGWPGTKVTLTDVTNGKQLAVIKIRSNRVFNGHGVFSVDSKLLFTTESVLDTSEGKIGVYDGKTLEFLRELPAYGLGPHGVEILPDNKTLAIAVGGLHSVPKLGKHYLNLNTMQSSLAFVDITNGKLLANRTIPVAGVSIRNVHFTPDGSLLIACHYWGNREMPKLVGIQRGLGEIEMLEIDDDNLWLMKNYVSGIVVAGNTAAVSCARGNVLTFWDLSQKKFITSVKIKDVAGLAISDDGKHFLASADIGELYQINVKSFTVKSLANWQGVKWTNHMIKTFV